MNTAVDVQMTTNSSNNPYLSNTEEESVSVGDTFDNGTHGTNSNALICIKSMTVYCCITQSCILMT